MSRTFRAVDGCAVCDQRITDTGWLPFCCEVCWDSADAAEHRLIDDLLRRETWQTLTGSEPVMTQGARCSRCGATVDGANPSSGTTCSRCVLIW